MSDRIEWVLNLLEWSLKNIRSITELESLGLFAYLVETRLMGDNLSRLNELAISIDGWQSL